MEKIVELEGHIQTLDRASQHESSIISVMACLGGMGRENQLLTLALWPLQWGECVKTQRHTCPSEHYTPQGQQVCKET